MKRIESQLTGRRAEMPRRVKPLAEPRQLCARVITSAVDGAIWSVEFDGL